MPYAAEALKEKQCVSVDNLLRLANCVTLLAQEKYFVDCTVAVTAHSQVSHSQNGKCHLMD